jgi:hypothetical protein
MKASLKALLLAMVINFFFLCLVAFIQYMLYGMESFEAFFGFPVGKFNYKDYLMLYAILNFVMMFILKSDFEEVKDEKKN